MLDNDFILFVGLTGELRSNSMLYMCHAHVFDHMLIRRMLSFPVTWWYMCFAGIMFIGHTMPVKRICRHVTGSGSMACIIVIRNESMSYINTKSEMIGMLQVVNPLWNCCGLVLFISHLLFLRCRENALGNGFYAPNFKDVKGAYWLGPVRLFVRLSVRPSVVHYALCWLYHYRAAWATNLKFYLQHEYKK